MGRWLVGMLSYPYRCLVREVVGSARWVLVQVAVRLYGGKILVVLSMRLFEPEQGSPAVFICT